MKKLSNKKTKHSMISNVFFMLKLMFKISPWLVIGEVLIHIIATLPSRVVSVIGLKFVIDEVQNGGDTKRILIGVILILGLLIIGEVANTLFFELFVHREREKLDLGIQTKLYKKAASIDIAKYDDPEFYADFILSVENTSDNLAYMLVTVRNYVAEFISLLLMSALLLTIDPVNLCMNDVKNRQSYTEKATTMQEFVIYQNMQVK